MKKIRFLVASGILVMFSCSHAPKAVDPATLQVPVRVVKVSTGSSAFSTQYPATINALNLTELRTNVSGFITGLYFKEGQQVKKGQKLYEIDKSKYLASYDLAKANYQIAIANLDRAGQDASRYQALLKQDAVARQQVDHSLTDLQNTKLQVVVARQAVKSAETDLRYSEITAPFNGIIGISQVRLGTLVQSGQTLLNTISTINPIAADVIVSQADLPLFQRFYKSRLPLTDSTFTLNLPDGSKYNGTGHISVIDRAIDPQTGTITIRLNFENYQQLLRPGMNLTLTIKEGKGSQGILIPSKSVTEIMGELFVFVVVKDKAHQKKILQGRIIADKLLVKSGLKEGDTIVTEGMGKLKEGSSVKIN